MDTETAGTTILLVDDNADDRALVRRALSKHGLNVSLEETFGPTQLAAALQSGSFSLVITDYQLQWTTGLDVLQKVKSRYPACPVIMYTGTGTAEIAVRGLKAGLADYVVKSEQGVEDLATSVERILTAPDTVDSGQRVLLVDD